MNLTKAIRAASSAHYMYRNGGWQRADGQHRWPAPDYWRARATVRDARIAYVLQHAAGMTPARAQDVATHCAPADGRWQDVARAMVEGRK